LALIFILEVLRDSRILGLLVQNWISVESYHPPFLRTLWISFSISLFAKNKKAYFDYEILEKFEAGISLLGQEVKSIKTGRINLKGSYIVLKQSSNKQRPEVFLIGANIPPYQPQNIHFNYDPQRSRKLLLKKRRN